MKSVKGIDIDITTSLLHYVAFYFFFFCFFFINNIPSDEVLPLVLMELRENAPFYIYFCPLSGTLVSGTGTGSRRKFENRNPYWSSYFSQFKQHKATNWTFYLNRDFILIKQTQVIQPWKHFSFLFIIYVYISMVFSIRNFFFFFLKPNR